MEEAQAPPPSSWLEPVRTCSLARTLGRTHPRPAGKSRLRWTAGQTGITGEIRPRGAGAAWSAATRRIADAEVVAVATAAVRTVASPAAIRRARTSRVETLRAVALVLGETLPRPAGQPRRVRAADQLVQARPVDSGVARAAIVLAVARRRALRPEPQPGGKQRRRRSRHPSEHVTPRAAPAQPLRQDIESRLVHRNPSAWSDRFPLSLHTGRGERGEGPTRTGPGCGTSRSSTPDSCRPSCKSRSRTHHCHGTGRHSHSGPSRHRPHPAFPAMRDSRRAPGRMGAACRWSSRSRCSCSGRRGYALEEWPRSSRPRPRPAGASCRGASAASPTTGSPRRTAVHP